MFEYSVSLYAFNKLLKAGELSKRAAMRFARSVGYQGIEMLDFYWGEDMGRGVQADELKAQAQAEGVSISCYTIGNDLALFEEKAWKKLVDRMLADVELAERLGTKTMRVEATWGPEGKTFEECLEPIAKGIKIVAQRAAEAGIKVGLENHGRFSGLAERMEMVIDAVGEENFGACVDIGNFLVVDENPLEAVERLAGRAVHVHVKDMHYFTEDPGHGAFATNAGDYLIGSVLGEGVVDVPGCLDILAKAGYSGWLSHEFEGNENLFFAVARGREYLSEAVSRLPLRG